MKREFKIGVFTVAIILGAWGGIRFLSGADIFSSDNKYYAIYDKIDGLQNSSPIYIMGVKVGSVTNIELNVEQQVNVLLEFTISERYNIPKNSKAKIFSDGLIGSKAVEINVGDSGEYLLSGDTITSTPSVDLFNVATTELQYLKSKIDTVTNELSSTLQNLNSMLESNAKNLGSMIANLDALSYNLNKLLEENSDNVARTTAGFADLSQTLGDNKESIEGIITNLNEMAQDLNNAEIDTTLTQINSILTKINQGEGNIGKIVNDEEVYSNLASATANLDSLLYDFKQNPKRYVHFSVFGQNESKQREKAERKEAKEASRTE